MNRQKQPFSIRRFLEEREALLIHFSTWQSMHREFTFPEDLRLAKTLSGVALAFSTIMAGDVGPYQADIHPEEANAQGSVGIVARILSDACVVAVGPSDHGTQYRERARRVVWKFARRLRMRAEVSTYDGPGTTGGSGISRRLDCSCSSPHSLSARCRKTWLSKFRSAWKR